MIIKVLKEILKKSKLVMKLYSLYFNRKYKRLYELSPMLAAQEYYSYIHKGVQADLDNPSFLEEKIMWLALKTDTSKWSDLSDKYAVREFVRQKGMGDCLNTLYDMWESPYDIDFDKLPNQFVMKTTNGCGTVLVIHDKEKIRNRAIIKLMSSWLKKEYGYVGYNGHYLRIKPRIIAEKLLVDDTPSGIPIDYKFYCTYGKPLIIEVCSDREISRHDVHATLYDTNWNVVHESSTESDNLVPRPKSLDKMIEGCEKLGGQFPFVRVDYYEIRGELVFGELTFTPEIHNFSDKISLELANQVDLSLVPVIN